jgi:hypothetical protein
VIEINKRFIGELMKLTKFIAELKRRNVIKAVIAYLAVSY